MEFSELFDMKYAVKVPIENLEEEANQVKKLFFSKGGIMPATEQLCLNSKPLNFDRRFYREAKTMYVNQDRNIAVYNDSSMGEAFNAILSDEEKAIITETNQREFDRFIDDLDTDLTEEYVKQNYQDYRNEYTHKPTIGNRRVTQSGNEYINFVNEKKGIKDNFVNQLNFDQLNNEYIKVYQGLYQVCKTPLYSNFGVHYTWDYKERTTKPPFLQIISDKISEILEVGNVQLLPLDLEQVNDDVDVNVDAPENLVVDDVDQPVDVDQAVQDQLTATVKGKVKDYLDYLVNDENINLGNKSQMKKAKNEIAQKLIEDPIYRNLINNPNYRNLRIVDNDILRIRDRIELIILP